MSTDDRLMIFDQLDPTVTVGPIDLLPFGNYPYDATIHPDGSELWIAGASGDGIVVIDAVDFSILHEGGFSSGAATYSVDVAFAPDGATAYVAARDADALIVVDVATYAEISVVPTPAGQAAGKLTVNPCNGRVYMVEWFGDELMTYDPSDGSIDTLDVGTASLWDLVVSASGEALYVTDRGNDTVRVFDVSGDVPVAVDTIGVGDDPWGIGLTPDGSRVVVACEDDHTVHFVDTALGTATSLTLPADSDPRDVDISADGWTAYVPTGSVAGAHGVYAIDVVLETLSQTIGLPPGQNANVVAVTPQAVVCDVVPD